MSIATIPASKVLDMMEAISDALKVCEKTEYTETWLKLNRARATMIVYMLPNIPKMQVEVV